MLTTICYSPDSMEALNTVNRRLQGNKLSLTIIKTQVMLIESKQKLSHMQKSLSVIQSSNMETEGIDHANQPKHLGLMIDDKLR